jgi:hypothetical protein
MTCSRIWSGIPDRSCAERRAAARRLARPDRLGELAHQGDRALADRVGGSDGKVLQVVHGYGYKLVAEVAHEEILRPRTVAARPRSRRAPATVRARRDGASPRCSRSARCSCCAAVAADALPDARAAASAP